MGNDSYARTNMNFLSAPLETAGQRNGTDQFDYFDVSEGRFKRALVPADTALVSLTATTAITKKAHANRRMLVTGTGSAAAMTLPEATGTGDRYIFIMGQVNTSGTTFVNADTTNCSYHGSINLLDVDGAAQTAYFTVTAGGTDTVTFNGTTTGGQIGDFVEFLDIATDKWMVFGQARVPAGSNPATPFSSAA